METVTVRTSHEVELPWVSALEKSSGTQFRAAGMELVADGPAPDPRVYRDAHLDGRLLVASAQGGALIGFVRIEMLDSRPHVEQVSVHPDHQGRGVGRMLLAAAEEWSRTHGYRRMTLTTFQQVPWNGPYYTRLGWTVLPEQEWGSELAATRAHERSLGLDAWPRQAMVKDIASTDAE